MSIDFSQPLETRDGRKVNIYTTTEHPDPDYPIVGSIQEDDYWCVATWTEDGHYFIADHDGAAEDLVNVRPSFRHERWVAVYADDSESRMFKTKREVEDQCPSRIAIKRLTIEGKEGDTE